MMRRSVLSNISNRPSLGPARRQSHKPPTTTKGRDGAPSERRTNVQPSNASSYAPRGSLAPRPLSLGGESSQPSKRSSVFGSGRSARKDPRDMKDKAYVRNLKRRLIAFLVQNGYNRPISEQTLAAPGSKDFFYFFEFIYRILDPKFVLEDQPAEQLARIIGELNYPTRITKSSLISPGSPHIWPNLLAALVWMVELIEYDALVKQQQQQMLEEGWAGGESAFDEAMRGNREEKLFYLYLTNAYSKWLNEDDDNFNVLAEDLKASFDAKNKETAEMIEGVKARNEALRREIEALQNMPSRIAPLTNKKGNLMKDIEKLKEHNSKLAAQKEALADRIEELEKALQVEEKDLSEITKENKELQLVLDAQEISPADIERLTKARQGHQETLQSLAVQKEQLDKIVWEREMTVAKRLDDVDKAVQHYNMLLTQLRLIGSSAKYQEAGFQFETLTFKPHAPTVNEMLSIDIKSQTKPKLQNFKEFLDGKWRNKKDKLLKTKDIEEACEEICNELNDNILLLESQLNQLEHTYKMEKEENSNALRQRAFEIETMQQNIEKLKLETNNLLAQSQKGVDKAKQDLEDVEKNCKKEKDAVAQSLIETLDVLVEHRLGIEQSLEGLQKDLKDRLNEAKTGRS